MNIGVTGSRRGLTSRQREEARRLLRRFADEANRDAEEGFWPILHHGDCVGADEQLAAMARRRNFYVVAWPPIDDKYRAFFDSDVVEDPAPYLDRNRSIAKACGILIATPRTHEVQRSGTWATVRYARAEGKPIYIISKEGTVAREE